VVELRIYGIDPSAIAAAGRAPVRTIWHGRLGILIQVASLIVTGWVTWFTTIHPRLHRLTLSRLLADAVLYALLACAWSAAITLALYLVLPKSESRNMLWATLRTSAVAVWFAPATILLSHVAPAALAASMALVVSATRLLYSEWLAVAPPVEEIPISPGMFGANLPPPPAITRELGTGVAAAVVLQTAVLAALVRAPLLSGALFALTGAILTMFAITAGAAGTERPTSLPRSVLGIVLTILLATGITVGGLHDRIVRGRPGSGSEGDGTTATDGKDPGASAVDNAREAMRDLLYGKDGAKTTAPGPEPPLPPDLTTNVGDGSFPGVILWPEIKPEPRLVAPLPVRGGRGLGFARPYTIPFGGEYWMYRFLASRPPPHSFFQRGNPAALSFSTTDRWPLQMEAHQKLDEPLDLGCCRAVQIDIWNADRYPGTVSVELFVVDGERSTSLGAQPVRSTPDLQTESVMAVPETLEFPLSAGTGQCSEFKVVFRRDRTRDDKSARIALERFRLLP